MGADGFDNGNALGTLTELDSGSVSTTDSPELERRRHRKKQRIHRKRRDRANHYRARRS